VVDPIPRAGVLAGYRRSPWLLLPYAVVAVSVLAVPVTRAGAYAYFTWIAISNAAIHVVGLGVSARAATHPRLDAGTRRPWRFLVAFFGLLIVNGMSFGVATARNGGVPPDSLSPMFCVSVAARVAAVPVLLAGLVSFAAEPLDRRARWKLAMDVTTVVGGGGMALWYFVVAPALEDGTRLTERAGFSTLVYSVGDLVLILGVCTVLLRGAVGSARRVLPLLLAGAVVTLCSDVFLAYSMLYHPSELAPPWFTLMTLMQYALPAFAAAEQCRLASEPSDDDARPRPLRPHNSLPYVALALGFGLLAVAAVDAGPYPWAGLVAGASVMTFGVAARQVVALRENHALVRTDGLTGLANRLRLNDSLHRAAERSRRTGARVAALAIDLDGFKQVNDSLGHEAGDAVLTAFADALRRTLRPDDLSARLGGDEFAVLLENVGEDEAIAVAERIVASLCEPVTVGAEKVRIRASVGIAVSAPGGELHPRDLLHHADIAMYAAKRQHRSGWRLYSEEAMRQDRDAAALRDDLLHAVESDQLRVLYQPIVTLATGALVAVEALVRWHHPTRGVVPPTEFIPLAEELGVIDDIGAWVLEQSCRQVRAWQERLAPGRALHLSVNFSAHQLRRPTLAAEVLETLARTGLDPHDLVLEITESALVDDDSAVPQLHELRHHGVRVALDDFGTGYSSLRYLTRLPVDILKLDRCFVAELNGDPEGSAVAEAVIRLGRILHLDTVAEGIEDPAQATELTLLGCRNAQGYHFARPLAADVLSELLEHGDAGPLHLPAGPLYHGSTPSASK
jgi:diguanylate cyclase (GGDEF)-like protein